jgi:hypothetical protein
MSYSLDFSYLIAKAPIRCPNPVSQSLFEGNVLSSSGTYIKRLCAINYGYTQEQAYQYCKSYNMRLYVINNDDEQNELIRMTTANLGSQNPNNLFVDGVCSNSKWFYMYSGVETPAYAGIRFKAQSSITCESLIISNEGDGKGFNMNSYPSVSSFWFVCETL